MCKGELCGCVMHRAVLLAGILVTTWSLCGADKATLHFGALLPTGQNPRFFNADVKDTCELALRHINEAPDILPNHTLVFSSLVCLANLHL